MNENTQTNADHSATLAENAQALVAATANVTSEKVSEARKRLAAALERSKEIYSRARVRTIEGAKKADVTVRENPYEAMAVAFGLGALIGFLATRRFSRNGD
jgi:ElaB/YqjD/DUF883 family membrane-anchored ribosome-binding protein